ncbi:putative quinol monooxygenase [Tumebacillus permanentifrigoris]|uniref:Quinol monooxygenase YgiN n=1 Tax=Tumebacillus permanentifrigoris TaxID=378543 RepID=A0A316D8Q3_9BACL|nr:putative quinol monooxygenase [Tumebacillus permanentifrigoris]PWK13339.1 quinol monooxygenase YgiN [Tumebacillus permanentifrigoris]
MIIIHAYLTVNPSQREEFLEKAKRVVTGTQAEAGNISYQLYEDAEQPNTFVILEKWQDQAAVAHHQQTAHFIQFNQDAAGLLAGPAQVEFYHVADNK